MTRRRPTIVLALCALLAAPAAASAQAPAGGAAAPAPAPAVAEASDGRHSIAARTDTLLGRTARFRGLVPSAHAGRRITVERWDAKRGRWLATATAKVASDGAYLARWRTDHIGRFRVRAVLAQAPGAQAAAASPELAVTVYKPALATWYGPGFYGRTTACGMEMTTSLVGVAHRTLPCGTNVAIHYAGHTTIVPVVDRGPFANGADWDLTYATAMTLGFTVTARIGAVRADR